MATVTCPSCGLPRAPDLIDTAACPVCGTVGALPEAVELSADPAGTGPPLAAEVHPPPAKPSGRAAGPVLGFAAGLAVGVGGVLGWQNLPATGTGTVGEPGGSRPPLAEVDPRPRLAAAVAPMPREVVTRGAAPTTPPGDTRDPSAPPGGSRPPLAGKDDPPGVPVAQPVPGRPAALTLDNPDGTSSPHVRPGSTLVLRGKVKKLVVSGLEAGAALDCAELDAAEVVVVGPVDGRSRLAVRAPSGRVTFTESARVGGGSAVEVTAREVGLNGRVDGAGTRVTVRLTEPGVLTVAEVDGPARVEYAADRPGGPAPKVITGRVGPGAVVRKVD